MKSNVPECHVNNLTKEVRMTESKTMLVWVNEALSDKSDWPHALTIARQLIAIYPGSEDARKAQAIVDKLTDAGVDTAAPTDEVYSEEQ
jgi:hypothetical protein